MSITIMFVVLVGLCKSMTLDVSGEVDLGDLQPDGILSTVLKLSYSLQMEAKALVSEAEKIRSEAQAMRSEAADSRREAEVMKSDVEMIRGETQKMQEDARSMMEEGKNSMNQAFEVLKDHLHSFLKRGLETVARRLKIQSTLSRKMLLLVPQFCLQFLLAWKVWKITSLKLLLKWKTKTNCKISKLDLPHLGLQ